MAGLFELILVIAIVVIGFYVLLKVVKSVLKAISFAVLILFLVSIIFGVIIYLDFKDIKENFPKEKSLVVLENEDEVLMLSEIIPSKVKEGSNPFTEIEDNEIEKKISNDNYRMDAYYKTIIFQEKLLREGLPGKFNLDVNEGFNITKEDYLEILRSENAKDKFIETLATGNDTKQRMLKEELENEEELENLKGAMLAVGVQEIINNKGEIYVIKQYRKGEIGFYPETISTKLFKLVPIQLFNIGNKTVNNTD